MPKVLQLTATFIILKCQNFRIFTNIRIIGCVNLNATNFAENLQSTAKCDQFFAVCLKIPKIFVVNCKIQSFFALCYKIRQKFRSSPYNLGTFCVFLSKWAKISPFTAKFMVFHTFYLPRCLQIFLYFLGEKKKKKLQG